MGDIITAENPIVLISFLFNYELINSRCEAGLIFLRSSPYSSQYYGDIGIIIGMVDS